MSTITKARLKERALEMLGVKPLFQGAQNQDIARIDEAYNEVYDQLVEMELATWAAAGPIPSEVAPYVVTLMAANALEDFSVPTERYNRIVFKAQFATRGISAVITPKYESLDDVKDY